jgi:hypothetical protein
VQFSLLYQTEIRKTENSKWLTQLQPKYNITKYGKEKAKDITWW